MPAFALGVYVTEQVDVLEVAGASVQVVELKVPDAAGAALKVTVPLGDDFVPLAVSVTVAVQVEGWLKATDEGAQLTAVEVER